MKKRVFISGVTGHMGREGLTHLLTYSDRLDIVTLVRPSKKNKKNMLKYDEVEVVWGDLTVYEDVKRSLRGVDYILHIAAFVSPEADRNPELAWKINVGSTENILNAVEELGLEDVKLVYIGSVAQTGDRLPPLHWGRIGDPIRPSIFDNYAVTKIAAERMVIESGLKYWVSLRQTGILHYGLISMLDAIIFHQPLNNVMEWITAEDSGRLLANICTMNLPDEFWNHIYNIGGGESCRKSNYEFTTRILKTIGVENIERIFEPNWFATKNFHGQYYLDSDRLNDFLDFRRESIEDFMIKLEQQIRFPNNLFKYLPNFFVKNIVMRSIAKLKNSTLGSIRKKDQDKINSYFSSLQQWKEIGSWEVFKLQQDYSEVVMLDHGYDETKDKSLLNIEDMEKAAQFRGGQCLSNSMIQGDLESKLNWICAFDHQFEASPKLILEGGHWCDECEAPPWNYEDIAKKNMFLRQVCN